MSKYKLLCQQQNQYGKNIIEGKLELIVILVQDNYQFMPILVHGGYIAVQGHLT